MLDLLVFFEWLNVDLWGLYLFLFLECCFLLWEFDLEYVWFIWVIFFLGFMWEEFIMLVGFLSLLDCWGVWLFGCFLDWGFFEEFWGGCCEWGVVLCWECWKKSVGLNIVIYVEIVNFVKEFFLRLICLYGCYFWDLLIIVKWYCYFW